ncbi:MAG: peptidoglycan D,D-transpeptidase FtsI family protein [Phycisphaerales bacterium]
MSPASSSRSVSRSPAHALARADRVARVLLWCLALGFGIMLGRVIQLQVAPPAQLTAHMGERISSIAESARRGDVLDRHGRVLAATRFGWRCFVDPTRMRPDPEADILALAQALGLPPEDVGPRILAKMSENQRRSLEAGDEPPALVRYVSIGSVLEDDRAESVRALKIPGVHLETRPVREVVAGQQLLPLLGKVGIDDDGLTGAERLLEKRLDPSPGRLEYVRDSRGKVLWVEPGGYEPPERGEDVRLSIDLQLQRIALEELQRGVEDADAQGGRCVIFDPRTGEILAMTDVVRPVRDAVVYDFKRPIPKDNGPSGTRYQTIRTNPAALMNPELARNRCIEDVYEPGSTFKPFMWSAILELGLADPEETINTEGGRWSTPYGRAIADVVKKDHQTVREVLINSSNIGMIKLTTRLSAGQMHDAVIKFGFGKRTGLGLPGEAAGIVTPLKNWSKYTHTSVATGYEIAVTPVQMVRAFSVFARSGVDAGTLPPIRLAPGESASTAAPGSPPIVRRVLPAPVAELARDTMRGVTANLDRKLAALPEPEKGWKFELFGKSGTAEIPLTPPPPGMKRPKGSDGYFNGQYNASFIAGGPVDEPRLVCLVVIDDPGPTLVRERRHYGASTAGPVVRRAMERALSYLGVRASPASDRFVPPQPE